MEDFSGMCHQFISATKLTSGVQIPISRPVSDVDRVTGWAVLFCRRTNGHFVIKTMEPRYLCELCFAAIDLPLSCLSKTTSQR